MAILKPYKKEQTNEALADSDSDSEMFLSQPRDSKNRKNEEESLKEAVRKEAEVPQWKTQFEGSSSKWPDVKVRDRLFNIRELSKKRPSGSLTKGIIRNDTTDLVRTQFVSRTDLTGIANRRPSSRKKIN